METNVESIIVEFNNKAAAIYGALSDQLVHSVFAVNRREDDNVFRLQAAKYISVLKERLEEEARKILNEHSTKNFYKQLNTTLPTHINYYLQEFRNKINSL